MPITEELKNVKKFESVGFSHDQAEALAETIEQAQIHGQESLKDFIGNEIGKLRVEFGNEFRTIHDQFKDIHSQFKDVQGQFKDVHSQFRDVQGQFKDILKEINASELRMKASQTDLLVKIFGIVVGTVGIAVTILKLFP